MAPAASVGGAPAENHDLEQLLADKTLPVIGIVLLLGFLLLLVALQAPLIAAIGVGFLTEVIGQLPRLRFVDPHQRCLNQQAAVHAQ